ncbi:thiol reductant ABC exporter subunit CydC [Aureimonas sp. AU40]|uniref:thiol reductant ABC exporter subunit CydC n=1 Tax=Aureimonas sp. AU40 TaxID=1637747 RepID=UPI0007861E4C|nr:thiol reductant ABC exporter subunit CydC [Aureimonas sp. AU40]
MSALLFFRPLFSPYAGRFALALGLSLLALLAGVLLLGTSGWFLSAASLTTLGAAFNLFGPSAAVRGLSMMRIGARYGEKLIGHDATLRVLGTIRAWTFRQMIPRVSVLDRALRRGDLVSRLTADVDALDTAFLLAVGPLLAQLAIGALGTLALHFILPPAAPIYLAGWGAASLLAPLLIALAGKRGGAAIAQGTAELRIAALDGVDGHADLLAFGRRKDAEARFFAHAEALGRLRRRQALRAAIGSAAVQGCAALTLVGVLVAGLGALEQGAISGPLLVGLLLAVLGSFEASALTMRGVARLGHAAGAARRLRDLAALPVALPDAAEPRPLPEGATLRFEGVSFGFDPERPILRALDLDMASGEIVAIRGPSGSGKSALLQLPLRLADPQSGRVLIAGEDIRHVARAELHHRVALLEQNAPVFLDTLRGNLLLSRADASDAELREALERVRLGALLTALPLGLDTPLGEAGRTLSAGEARRLCLARTLLSPAAILVLDEPTSGLDRDTELAFLADLPAACAGRTVILSTHAELPAGAASQTLRLTEGRLVQAP